MLKGEKMFELDEKFFEELGVNNMPVDEAQAFKDHVREEIEVRVGERISDGVPPEKLNEFEKIIDATDDNEAYNWLLANSIDYHNDELYTAIQSEGGSEQEILSEYAALKWIQLNRPDFSQIIATVSNELKKELKENIDKII